MEDQSTEWESYEQVAAYLLDRIAPELGLERVEGKQGAYGSRTGVTWEIDGKGVKIGDEGFLIIECRRYTTSKIKQEAVAAVAYRIIDTGAAGAIIVSPLGFQEGASKVASAANVHEVRMNADSTQTDYFLSFLNKAFVGSSDAITITESAVVTIIEGDVSQPDRP
jgi:hypothetical protein